VPFSPDNPPTEKVRGLSKLSEKLQRQWVNVWNSCYSKLKEEKGKVSADDEQSCYRQAWSVVNKQRKKKRRKAALALATMLPKQDELERAYAMRAAMVSEARAFEFNSVTEQNGRLQVLLTPFGGGRWEQNRLDKELVEKFVMKTAKDAFGLTDEFVEIIWCE
jgi:sugar diacid utilization regulator